MSKTYFIDAGTAQQESSWVLAVRGRAQFSITVQHKKVEGTDFGAQYLKLIEANTDAVQGYVRIRDLLQFICEYCLPLFEQIAPQSSILGCTVEDLVRSPIYNLEIANAGVSGNAVIRGADSFSLTPALSLCPISTASLPAGCEAIPWFRAKDIILNGDGNDAGGVQGRIMTADGRALYFKPRQGGREGQFYRELDILAKIKRTQLANGPIKLSVLQGLVVTGEKEEECVGLLIDLIATPPWGGDLLSPGCWEQSALHLRWEQQVTTTVKALHAQGIVWGDVNAGNVVIDEALDPWVIDFGGMNNPEFVDDDKAETIEGDWQGVGRLFQEWLPERRRGIPL